MEIEDVLRIGAMLGVGLEIDLEDPPLQREIVHVARAEAGADRRIDIGDAHPERFGAGPVDVDVDLRHVGAEGRRHAADFRLLVDLRDEGAHHLRDLFRPLALQRLEAQVEAADRADAGNGRRRKDGDIGARDGRELRPQLCKDGVELQFRRLALAPRDQAPRPPSLRWEKRFPAGC